MYVKLGLWESEEPISGDPGGHARRLHGMPRRSDISGSWATAMT